MQKRKGLKTVGGCIVSLYLGENGTPVKGSQVYFNIQILPFYNFLFPVTLTKKDYFFTRFGKFDKENFIFLLTFANLTKKNLFFCPLWRIRRKKFCILSLSPFSQKYTVQVLKFFKTGFAALFLFTAPFRSSILYVRSYTQSARRNLYEKGKCECSGYRT